MAFLDDFHSSLEALPAMLERQYSVIRDLDKSLQVLQRQNEHRCEQEIEEFKRGIQSGNTKSDSPHLRLSSEALDEQNHCIRISDEKVALAITAYDVVDQQIQQLDEYLKKCEDVPREREVSAAVGDVDASSNNPKTAKDGESGRGVRKKTRTITAAAVTGDAAKIDTPVLELDIPVDPNEPTYCLCNQVSYGEMIACDNPDCKIEWFHYGCVGIKEQPKGKWYCSNCIGKKRRKGK